MLHGPYGSPSCVLCLRVDTAGMGLQFRRRVPAGKGQWLNVSGSGVSASKRVGRVTVNSRGRLFVRLGRGLYWRSGR